MERIDVYKFCPRCGGELKASQKRTYLVCSNCGLHYYINPKPSAAAVLKNQAGEYLFVERAIDPQKGYWDLPGGFIEHHENFEDGLKRELMEELNIKIDDIKYFRSYNDKYIYQNINYEVVVVIFTGSIKDITNLLPKDDVASYKFLKPKDIPVDRLAFSMMSSVLKDLKIVN